MGRSRREVRQFIRKRRWCVDFTGSEDDDIVLGGVEWYLQWCKRSYFHANSSLNDIFCQFFIFFGILSSISISTVFF